MHEPTPSRFERQLARQRGLATVRQLNRAGVDDWSRRSARADGFLEKAGAHVYRSAYAQHSRRDDLAALLLDCGAGTGAAWASGPTAAALHGFDGFALKAPFHITVERGRNIQRVGHHVHTSVDLPLIDRAVNDGLAVLAPARTVIDLAKSSSVAQLTISIDSMLRDGGASEELLHKRLVALGGRGRHGVPKVVAAIAGADARRGGHSWLERRYLELLAGAGLPRPSTQQVLARAGDRLVRVDCRFDGTPVVVELLGYRFHRTEMQMTRDAERSNALLLQGLLPVQFTYRQITEQPDQVIVTTCEALAQHQAA